MRAFHSLVWLPAQLRAKEQANLRKRHYYGLDDARRGWKPEGDDAYQLPSPVSQNSCAPCFGDALPNSVNGIIASIRKYVAVFDLDFRIQQSAG